MDFGKWGQKTIKRSEKLLYQKILLLLFYPHTPKYQIFAEKHAFSKVIIHSRIYEGAHLVKSSSLALLHILVQLVQKPNQNVSVKHPVPKINLIQNQTKIKKCCQKKFLNDWVTKLMNLFVFVKILWNISSHWWF